MAFVDTSLHRRIVEWLNATWPEPRTCVICRSDNWCLGSFVEEVPQFLDESLREDVVDNPGDVEPEVAAYVTVTCLTCAHTHFFNAELAGIVPSERLRERARFEARRLRRSTVNRRPTPSTAHAGEAST